MIVKQGMSRSSGPGGAMAVAIGLLAMLPLSQALALDDFAARLLCSGSDEECAQAPSKPEPVVVKGITLPADAKRDHEDVQRVLVGQGLYLTEGDDIRPLAEDEQERVRVDRGTLQIKDHGAVEIAPGLRPITIFTPKADNND